MNARVRQQFQALVGMGDTRPFYYWTSTNAPPNQWRNPHYPFVHPGMMYPGEAPHSFQATNFPSHVSWSSTRWPY